MNFPKTKHPIHPVYQAICDNHMKDLEAMKERLSTVPKYELFTEIRFVADEFAKQVPLPETIRTKQEVFHENRRVSTAIFRPLGSENQVLPVILYFHGGGWALGSTETYAKLATDLCIKSHAAVMLVEYSLSPEVQFPVANEESFAALCWLREHGKSIHVNPDQIVVAGDSAGGNMATVICMMAKARGMDTAIKAQILLYPVVSADMEKYSSYKTYGGGECYLSLFEANLFLDAYLEKSVEEMNDHYLKPILATKEQLQGLPPALVLTSECDILRDEGEEYAVKLTEAGVEVSAMRVLGTIHAFMTNTIPETPQYRTCIKMVCDFVRENIF